MAKAGLFKTIDVQRLLKAAKGAGIDPERVEIEVRVDGSLVMRPAQRKRDGGSSNPWDEVLED